MATGPEAKPRDIVPNACIGEYFHDAVTGALSNQNVHTDLPVASYLSGLLVGFTNSASSDAPPLDMPLALLLAQASEAPPPLRTQLMRQLGDLALFVSGFFADSLNPKTIDVGYYIDMGGFAYARVANAFAMKKDGKIWCTVFEELHSRFAIYVDVFAEISERSSLAGDEGIVQLYEKWLATGNQRLARRLAAQGVLPQHASGGQPQ